MTGSQPSKAEADRLVAAQKVVSAKLEWRCDAAGSWRTQAKVLALDSHETLELRAQIGRRNYSFALLYQNQPIRRFTKHYRHPTPAGVFTEPHKHVWDPALGDVEAYVPDDINPADDINDQFLAFCRECHIELLGEYQRVVYALQ